MRGLLRLQQARPKTTVVLVVCAAAMAGWLALSLLSKTPEQMVADRLEQIFSTNTWVAPGMVGAEQELAGLEPRVAAVALIRVIERQQSRLKDLYQEIYFKVVKPIYNNRPAFWQRVLPVPADRRRVTMMALSALRQLGPQAAPAVPTLIKVYEREYTAATPLPRIGAGMGGLLRQIQLLPEIAVVLGTIGPAATSAIPALLISLDPRRDIWFASPTEALLRIDPNGDETTGAMSVLSGSSRHAGLAVAIATNCVARLASGGGKQPPIGSWEVFEAASCVRSEAALVIPAMLPWLQAEDERYRAKTAACLGRLGSVARASAPGIRTLLQDPWLMVREAATNALIAIEGQRP